MAIRTGSGADVYIIAGDGTGTVMTNEATTLVSGTTYQIDDTAKRIIDPGAAVVVNDGGSPIAISGYEIIYPPGKAVLAAAPGGAVTITGKYLTAAAFGQAHEWSASVGPNLVDTAVFGAAWEAKTAVQRRGSVTLTRFYNDEYFHTEIDHSNFVLILYANQSAGPRWMAVGKLSDANPNFSATDVARESITFATTGWWDFAAT